MFGLCIDTVFTKEDKGGTGGFDRDEEHPMKNLEQLKLTKKQQALVDVLLAEGGTIKAAAAKAGYAVGESGQVSASRTLKLPHVQQYMAQATQQRLGLNALMAVNRVAKLAEGAKSEYVQLQAAQDILDRAGYKPIDRSQVQIAGDIRVSIDLG
jgi:phage terminase small subunit